MSQWPSIRKTNYSRRSHHHPIPPTMKFNTVALAATTLVVALAMPAKAYSKYATFYNDAHCSEGAGEGVSIDNPGCLSEAGRGSVYIPDWINGDPYCLVVTRADGSCSCQSSGYNFLATGHCLKLNPDDRSYRFVGEQTCDPNNC